MTTRKRVEKVKNELLKVGPMLPGSVSEQWNVCGTPNCACKNPTNPQKHGPYFQLSFSVKGRSSTMFIKPEAVPDVRRRILNYKRFKELSFELIQAYVDLAREEGLKGGNRG